MATPRDWQRLGGLVGERRGDLGLTQEDVRAAGGPSTATQRLIEGGHQSRYQPVILSRLESALGWQRGSVRRILAGGDPVLANPEPAPVTAAGAVALPPAAATSSATAADEVTRAVVVAAIGPRRVRQVWAEVHQHPDGTPASVIFADPVEAALFDRDAPELQRIRWIAALRSVDETRPIQVRQAGLPVPGALIRGKQDNKSCCDRARTAVLQKGRNQPQGSGKGWGRAVTAGHE